MLKSLELFGFKSFADRTTFEFAEGITCVVGPNGSGKSNVVDAIKWILGDQSAKSLRGKEMADVIFNGSSGRKASGFAEATLSFDNSQGLLPLDAAEVQIGRRLYASGDSEYLLNKSAVRLKDIRELFMGTGAGTAAYSIIEQGRVDQILQANPTTRRVVFEEAAGISRYKARKVEAQRRLERVDQNLLRLQDIVDQLDARLTATRSQASKAVKYRELSSELRELWTGLAADDYRRAEIELSESASEANRLNERLAAADAELSKLEQQLAEIDAQATHLEDVVRQIDRRRSSVREEVARHESAVLHQTTQQEELSAEIDRLRRQRHVLRTQSNCVAEDLQESTRRLDQFQRDFEDQQQALEQRAQRIEALRTRIRDEQLALDQKRSDLDELQRERTKTVQELAAVATRRETIDANEHDLDAHLRSLADSLAEAREELAERRRALDEAARAAQDAQARIDQARSERRQLRGAHDRSERQLAAWREERSAKLARCQLLEDLERRQEGINLGVRDILRRAAESRKRPWSLIRGHVGDLLECELDDAPLLEVALGSRVQLLVIDDLAPLVDFLNHDIADVVGRVGFVEVGSHTAAGSRQRKDAGEDRADRAADVAACPGVVGRADQLVSHSAVPGLAARLLSDTWIVETLDDALRLSAGEGRGCRFVTQQGELLDADGALFVGNAASEGAVISRKSELRQLTIELQRLHERITGEQQRLAELDNSLTASGGHLHNLQAEFQERMELLAYRKSEHASQAVECGRIQAEIDAAHTQQERLTSQRADMESQRTSLQQTLVERDGEIEALQLSIEEDAEIIRAAQGQLQHVQHETNAEQLQLAKHEERLSALQAAQMRLLDDQRERLQQTKLADDQLHAALRKRQESIQAILAARAELAVGHLDDERLLSDSREQQRALDDCRKARNKQRRDQESLRDQHREVSDQRHTIEMRTRDIRHQMTSLEERIREEFQLELTDLIAQGCTASTLSRESQPAAASSMDTPDVSGEELDIGNDMAPHDRAADHSDNPRCETFANVRTEIEARVQRLQRKIKALGAVNPESLQDLDELESRHSELAGQLEDLEQAKATLEEIIRRINVESRRLFLETFASIRLHFRELFRKLFGGGEGDIILEDPDDVLECGIDIVARPPGKELRSISLLSGGEKTMTAVALLFAMFQGKPSPYCILDEVDAALDEANVDRYVSVVKEFRESTQFVIITHRKRTMTAADRLYGVTMEQAGVSKRLTVQFEDVSEDGHIRTERAAA